MMTGQEVLSEYAAVADLTGQMLAAAEAGDWDHLVVLEQECTLHVNVLKREEAAVQLNPSNLCIKIDCIKRILADDRRIRDLTMPWMAHLSALINNSGTQRRLNNAYGSV
ncbi:flagellar protein FliT [Massilia sp. Dwa41.01b]|nr:flagellar protein FliT [Massilia sp. Dwa41.01b]QNB01533.1 flagellar protein FliT [Massilia sp. Se16.2.3]